MKTIIESIKKYKDIYIIILFIALLGLLGAYRKTIVSSFSILSNLFTPLYIGIGLAYFLNTIMMPIENLLKKITKKETNRKTAVLLTYIILLLIIVILFWLVIPQLMTTISSLVSSVNTLIKNLNSNFDAIAQFINNYTGININVSSFNEVLSQMGLTTEKITTTLTNFLSSISSNLVGSITSIGSSLYNVFMGLVLSIYLLAGKEKFQRQLTKILASIFNKDHANLILNFLEDVNKIFSSFISGQLLEAVIVGCLMYLTMLILRLPYSLLIAVIITAFAIIPIFGSLISLIIGTILILAQSPIQALIFLGVFLIIQQIEGNFIYPRVVGSSVGLSAIFTLLGVSIFGGLYGFVGMLIGVPITASFYSLIKKIVNYTLLKKEIILDENGRMIDSFSLIKDKEVIENEKNNIKETKSKDEN